jgi:dsDNA-specific endonuclease/ATPase MutS2
MNAANHGGLLFEGEGILVLYTVAVQPEGENDFVAIPIEDALDLHPFRPGETASVVAEYIAAAAAKGLREVRLIHGRGIGVQRAIVRKALERSPFVESFADATPERGGWGATVVRLAGKVR